MMRSASRQALAALGEQITSALGGRASVATLTKLAEELYAVADLLVKQPRLRRTLGDPATSADSRAELIERLLSGKVAKPTLQVAKAAVSERWSSPWDLTDALESAGDDALFAAAEKDGELDRVEDELFRFERILESDGDLTGLLDEHTVDTERRTKLLDSLLKGKVSPITLNLLHHAVASQRKRGIGPAIDDLLEHAASRQGRSVARVTSAVPLSDGQHNRLAAALTDLYRRPISIRTAIDPSVRGGLVVRVGDEVIDGSIAHKLTEARSLVAG
ncbi:MAG: F-type H+-transporting ATPase subunit delta [Pseudonocardiales bacterium]|jgi:F-type H+-transporting ATPase subunit delta|nr:F-type H+-transporting ATPase subunit delta [Microbacteriaceae bacterium]MDT4901663.1 F-type H+-transporting ATPase subunit delta [Pseudonocardiales bacterium]MDT4928876.1 F-type H+-transporting ATPase subunit delta [Pseudonocardiales bacterium]